jgi:hypothetical protein
MVAMETMVKIDGGTVWADDTGGPGAPRTPSPSWPGKTRTARLPGQLDVAAA